MEATDDEAVATAMAHASFIGRDDMDGLPTSVDLDNRDEFISMFCRYKLLLSKKPYLDQMVVGLNHYGVSRTM